MSADTRPIEIESYCGHCGERLPDLGDARVGACPNCEKRFRLPDISGGSEGRSRSCGDARPREFTGGAETREPSFGARNAGGRGGCCGRRHVHRPRPAIIRDPILAALLSAMVPGLGQAYNGQPLKAFLVFMTCFLVFPYFLGILDAYLAAREINRIQPAVVRRGCYAGCR